MSLLINTNYNNIWYTSKQNSTYKTCNNISVTNNRNEHNIAFGGLKSSSLYLKFTSFINRLATQKDLTWEIPHSIVEEIKRERPHLNKEMQKIYAERLMRVKNGLSPYYEGPIDDFDRAVHKRFVRSKAGLEDAKDNIKKIVISTDKEIPIQEKRILSEDEYNIINHWYDNGTDGLYDEEKRILNHLIETSTPLKTSCIVYRGIIPRDNNLHNYDFLESIKTGSIITNSLWTCTAPSYSGVFRFHPDNPFYINDGKGYIMRIKLPSGTKGLDLRGTNLYGGNVSEYILPPNSVIKVNKADHINQILDCEYILPKHQDYTPNPQEFDMKIPKKWKYEFQDTDWTFKNPKHKEVVTIKYQNRTIHTETDLQGERHIKSKQTDIRTNPDGTQTEVKTLVDEKYTKVIEKTIKDKNGKIIFYKKITDTI